jgi:hypothetical protein
MIYSPASTPTLPWINAVKPSISPKMTSLKLLNGSLIKAKNNEQLKHSIPSPKLSLLNQKSPVISLKKI